MGRGFSRSPDGPEGGSRWGFVQAARRGHSLLRLECGARQPRRGLPEAQPRAPTRNGSVARVREVALPPLGAVTVRWPGQGGVEGSGPGPPRALAGTPRFSPCCCALPRAALPGVPECPDARAALPPALTLAAPRKGLQLQAGHGPCGVRVPGSGGARPSSRVQASSSSAGCRPARGRV